VYTIITVRRIVDKSGTPIPGCALQVVTENGIINVPPSEYNIDYQSILKWIDEGNFIEDYHPSISP